MTKRVIGSLLLLLFGLTLCFQAQQAKPDPNPKRIEFTYDKFTDITTARSQPLPIEGNSLGNVQVHAWAKFKGTARARTSVPEFSLHFTNFDVNGGLGSYRSAKAIQFLLDEGANRFELPVKYERTVTRRLVLEVAEVPLSLDHLGAFVKAETIEIKWGGTEMKIPNKAFVDLLQFVGAVVTTTD